MFLHVSKASVSNISKNKKWCNFCTTSCGQALDPHPIVVRTTQNYHHFYNVAPYGPHVTYDFWCNVWVKMFLLPINVLTFNILILIDRGTERGIM